MRFKYVTLFIIILCCISYSQDSITRYHGTILIGITRNDTMWIGVDSKSIGNNGEVHTVCKIIKTPEFVFAHAGLTQVNIKSGNKIIKEIKIDSLFYDAYKQGISMDKTMEIFNKNFIHMQVIEGSHMNSKANYPINFLLKEIASTIFFAKYANNKIEFIFNYYFPIVREHNHIEVKFSPHKVVSKIGDDVKIAPFFPRFRKKEPLVIDISKDIPSNLRKFIKHQITVDSTNLGLPINIIQISKDGIDWIDKHQPCN